MKFILYTNDPSRDEAMILNEELKVRGHISKICTTWSVDLPHEMNLLPEADLVYVVTPVLFNCSTFELANRFITLEAWEKKAVVINPLYSLLHSTKAHFTNYCSILRIPHPRTLVTENLEKALSFILSLFHEGRKVILKPVARGEGFGIKLLQFMDSETLLRYLLWYSSEYGNSIFYLQEFIENFGYDIRIFIINDHVVARMKRSKQSDFRFNLSRGGIGEVFQGTEYDSLALKSAQAIGAKVAGVDILPTERGPLVLEVNVHPGFKGLIEVTGIPIPELLADYFESFR
jgi:RimK family alpha-L-glutamate ligase